MGILSATLESDAFLTAQIQVLKVTGREKISELYKFEIDVVMRDTLPLPAGAAPGARVALVLTHDGGVRTVHGILEAVEDRLDALNNFRLYKLVLVPELSRLKLFATQEVFVNMSVPDIITDKLSREDLDGTRLRMSVGTYSPREFVAQYKESDLAFISRLAEHLGISYVFEHPDAGPEKLVFTDSVVTTGLSSELNATMAFDSGGQHNGVFSLVVRRQMVPRVYVVKDYNYRSPLVDNFGSADVGEAVGSGGGIIEYGSHHVDPTEGASLAAVRSQEHLSQREIYTGKSGLVALTAGATPTLTGHPMLSEAPELLIVEVIHEATFGVDPTSTPAYENSFTAISTAVNYRPPRVTPRPRIHGLVTGTIALGSGSAGGLAQIDVDGRYRVQLHHDSVEHQAPELPSHPVRMAQPFAGSSHGFHFPLRPGTEVVLAFLDGDPDRPIIVGSVPNTAAPSTTTAGNASRNRVSFTSGVLFEIGEGR